MADGSSKGDESARSNADPLRLVLHTMEEQLDHRIDAVGSAGPTHEESTAGLIRLEETLSSAQDKAKQLVTLRLKLDGEATADAADSADSADSAAASPSPDAAQAARSDAPADRPPHD